VAKEYPHKNPTAILDDLVSETPGEEGKWFAAAKDAELFDEAIALANRTPCSPQTLTRAAGRQTHADPLERAWNRSFQLGETGHLKFAPARGRPRSPILSSTALTLLALVSHDGIQAW
jgi:hypothetical protein